ncbi:hypothetical protein BD626DRAFT_636532 [Schizophyllum amplum]|uniref:Zn(2)-C6 fungal-type domain-containing protein n=1 Tax=Schizophyllum amplum TaxID=97359 RepID=A0A550BT85_9AGAR|nr:hypothetical protein BD626DRAFT_636532 [Auriculariopsis ampla]
MSTTHISFPESFARSEAPPAHIAPLDAAGKRRVPCSFKYDSSTELSIQPSATRVTARQESRPPVTKPRVPAKETTHGQELPADRAKGAARAKSGCYTCRVRRKKCDEERDEDGHCRTCTRLRLQCLGFGTKLPEYLRVSSARLFFRALSRTLTHRQNIDTVNEMRDKIKLHLDTNNMIKRLAGSSALDDRPVCVLHEGADPERTPSPKRSSCTLHVLQ